MDEFSDEVAEAIKQKPLCNDLRGLRESLRDLKQAYDSTSQSDSSSIDISLSPVEELLTTLVSHTAAYLLKVETGYVALELIALVGHIKTHGKDGFDYQHYRALLSLVIEESSSDSAIWSSVLVLIQRPSTPPASRSPVLSSLKQTPLTYTSGSLEDTHEHHIDIDPVLKKELRSSLRIDVPDFVKDVFRQVLPLEKLAMTAFERCQQIEKPAYKLGKGWTEWPEIPLQDRVLEFLKKIVPCLISLVEKEDGYVSPGRRRIHARPNDPLPGSSISRKVDIGVLRDDGQCSNDSSHWKNVLAIGELKSNNKQNNREETFLDLAQYAREVFRTQDRRFVLGFTLCGSMMRLWQFDRSGSSGSASFDINIDGLQFIRILLGFYLMNNEQLGFDPTVQHLENGERYIDIFRADRTERLTILGEIRKHPAIVGRATTCWRVHCDEGNSSKDLVVKDSWQYVERPEEGELIKEATEKGVCNIARYYHHETVQINDKDDDIFGNVRRGSMQAGGRTNFREKIATDSLASASNSQEKTTRSKSRYQTESRKRKSSPTPILSDPKRPRSSLSTTYPEPSNLNRVHRRVVTCSPGTPIDEAPSCLTIINGFIGAISGHESLYNHARILHRDISIGNIMLNEAKDDGFLIDFDLAIKLDREEPSGAKTRTGTKVFMSIGALFGDDHTFMHDLESFFWVLFWICIHCLGPKELGKVEHRKVHSFEKWNYAEPRELAKLKSGEMSHFYRNQTPYTEYCKPLVSCLVKLQKAIFPNGKVWEIEDALLYSKMKRILREARDEIKAGSVG